MMDEEAASKQLKKLVEDVEVERGVQALRRADERYTQVHAPTVDMTWICAVGAVFPASSLSRMDRISMQEILDAEDFLDALNLDVPDVRWALGQALSRAYGSSPALIPIVDCVNHSRNTTPPITCAAYHHLSCHLPIVVCLSSLLFSRV
jgi:hypothetical protein